MYSSRLAQESRMIILQVPCASCESVAFGSGLVALGVHGQEITIRIPGLA